MEVIHQKWASDRVERNKVLKNTIDEYELRLKKQKEEMDCHCKMYEQQIGVLESIIKKRTEEKGELI